MSFPSFSFASIVLFYGCKHVLRASFAEEMILLRYISRLHSPEFLSNQHTNTPSPALAPWGALGGGQFKTEAQRKEAGGRNFGEASETVLRVSKKLEEIANKKNTSITSVALAYAMHKYPYVYPIVGGRKVEHLKSNIEALSLELSEEEVAEIEKESGMKPEFPEAIIGNGKQGSVATVMAGPIKLVEGPKVCCILLGWSMGIT